jgi:glycosyltransferase involved in cell wall biosynthesis
MAGKFKENIMPIAKDSLSTNAKGGTELMKERLAKAMPPALLDKFQVFLSRVHEELSDKHVRVLWFQDISGDPESEHLANGGWEKFHKFVFASHWQMRGYIERYNIPWSKCVVIRNAIEPIELVQKDRSKIKLTYISTPHRGLNILYPVFNKLAEEYDDIELDVYSSFKLYGWGDRDEQFKDLFEALKAHPKINYNGSVPNSEIRAALQKSHILAYPNTWQETSCISLIEAMSAGLVCVHSNLAALSETAANWTHMYQYHENPNDHAQIFYNVLKSSIEEIKNMPEDAYVSKIRTQKAYADVFYNWDLIQRQWLALLTSLQDEPTAIKKPQGPMFEYRS